jgi:NAD(P)-dependent dehydrogenase (short-subunit alcohol dehydrogenase family)
MTTTSSSRAVLVTGGTGGIGRHIARAFADDGARVGITSRRADADRERAQLAVPLDLEDPASATAAVGVTIRELRGLDTLVVNAVRWPTQTSPRFEDLPAGEWRSVLRANVEGAFAVVQAALPALRASGRGRIVLVSSGAAEEGHPVSPHYVAAKAALHGLGRALAWDAGADGILTNVIAVGFTRTGQNQDRLPDALFERAGALTPQRRVSTGEDVARVVLWLGSDANTSVTGEVIREGTSAARTPLVALTER